MKRIALALVFASGLFANSPSSLNVFLGFKLYFMNIPL